MRVLLTTLNAKYIHVNLAIRLLYELNKETKGLEWREFTIKENKDEIAGQCKDYDVVAFSCYIWNITQTLDTAQRIKALNPNTTILLGGPEVSYDWKEVLQLPYVDYIITGEGEIPFSEFLRFFPNVDHISNLAGKKNGEIFYAQKGTTFDLLNYKDILPYAGEPAESLRSRVLYIETSRGCPYKCEFCLASLDNKVRYLPSESIKANLLYLMQHGKVIKFLDRTFNIKRDFTIDIFTFILEHHRPENVFQFEITADILHPDIIKFIDEKVPEGLFRFEIGIQTVNQKANLEVSRKQNFEKTKKIIQSLQHKVEMHLDLIVGLPLDYWDDIKYSFEEVFKLHAPELQLGFLKFLKGTPMRDKVQHGFVFDPNPPYQLIESKYLSQQQLKDIVCLEHALEIYWNDKRAVNLLRYMTTKYSTFDFLMSLGIYFGTQRDYHQFSLKDMYTIALEFIEKNYPEDIYLKQLLAIDYYLQHKVKPQSLIVPDMEAEQKKSKVQALKLSDRFRYVMLELDFDYGIFERENKIVAGDYNFIVRYSGTAHPEIVSQGQLLQNA